MWLTEGPQYVGSGYEIEGNMITELLCYANMHSMAIEDFLHLFRIQAKLWTI